MRVCRAVSFLDLVVSDLMRDVSKSALGGRGLSDREDSDRSRGRSAGELPSPGRCVQQWNCNCAYNVYSWVSISIDCQRCRCGIKVIS